MSTPANPKIYHITHMNNLPGLLEQGGLWSDAQRILRSLGTTVVGMSEIKSRRLKELCVTCHGDTKVGEYVPFYFCPRSIMLYILHKGNHPGVTYTGGQSPIVHLQADLRATVLWAEERNLQWAFSKSNAGARYCDFYNSLDHLHEINWSAVTSNEFWRSEVKEGKQAEFLLFDWFPWDLVEKVGVIDRSRKAMVEGLIQAAEYKPEVSIERGWYI